MRDRGVASRYARALVESAKAEDVLAGVAESYAAVVVVLEQNPALPSFLEGPQVADDEKIQLVSDLFDGRVEPLLVRFFHLLIEKNRIEYLQEIGEEFAGLVEKEQGFSRAVVTTAIEMPADLEAALLEKLVRLTGAKVILEKNVDPAVIGGVSVTLGDQIIDGTVRTNLDQLRLHLGKARVR